VLDKIQSNQETLQYSTSTSGLLIMAITSAFVSSFWGRWGAIVAGDVTVLLSLLPILYAAHGGRGQYSCDSAELQVSTLSLLVPF
jgi:hypothetical protein